MNLFLIGFGYTGRRLATRAMARGWPVTALVRSSEAAQAAEMAGCMTVAGDLDHPATLQNLPLAGCHLWYAAPPPAAGSSDPRIAHLGTALDPKAPPAKIVYLSTSGVYGDCQGQWVNEQCPPAPGTNRARRRLAAEDTLLDWGHRHAVPVTILRVAGIYGPQRLPLAALAAGEPQLCREQAPMTSRVHIDDLVTACLAALERGAPGEIYNVADDAPSTMTDYFLAVAEAFGLPAPPLIRREDAAGRLSPAMLSFLAESRRVDNHKLLTQLGVRLAYPDLASGLTACREALRA